MTGVRRRLGVALGGGAARGWAHFGVLRVLGEIGFEPEVVCGTSVGAMVGAAYASGRLDAFEQWVAGLTRWEMLRMLDWTGFGIQGERLMAAFREQVPEADIADLPRRFGCVATDVATGREVWFTDGDLHTAVRASIALPGLFRPMWHQDRWLVDGGLVDPVPVSLCKAMGADRVIAVNLNADLLGRSWQTRSDAPRTPEWWDWVGQRMAQVIGGSSGEAGDTPAVRGDRDTLPPPSVLELMMSSMHIMQDRITRSRLAGDPPDLELAPRLGHVALFDFHRVADGVAAGRMCAERHRDLIADLIERRAGAPPPAGTQ